MAIHKPVLLKEVLGYLKVKKGGRYIDATLGEGGHAKEILKGGGEVLGIEQDPSILEEAKRNLGKQATLMQGNFRRIDEIAKEKNFTEVDGILMDLGISSWHLEESGKGFTFQKEEPLDMRADPTLNVTAADLLNGLTKHELERLIRQFGEEERAGELARALVRARSLAPFKTTGDLLEIVSQVKGERGREKLHPATKIFQALRIAVNDELGNLRSALPRAFGILGKNGTLAVISFHSLEDREVKRFFAQVGEAGQGEVLTKKPTSPSSQEFSQNPRSRSARLRALKKR
ncbi:MAG: 16S rRNA (cytosine(1402)-N(4))-methyltransferase RsmH [Patescibacteria group bacterium]